MTGGQVSDGREREGQHPGRAASEAIYCVAAPLLHPPAIPPPVQVFHATPVYQPHPYAQPFYYPAHFPGQQPYGGVPYPYPYPQDAALLEKLGQLHISSKAAEKTSENGKADVSDAPPAYHATQKKEPKQFILRIDGISEKVGRPALRDFAETAGITKMDGTVDKFGVQRGKVKFIFPAEGLR